MESDPPTVTRSALVLERINRGMSINAAADAIGIARGTLNAFERYESISLISAKRIADYYGCKVTDLVQPAEEAAA